jgi:hypothetical protein
MVLKVLLGGRTITQNCFSQERDMKKAIASVNTASLIRLTLVAVILAVWVSVISASASGVRSGWKWGMADFDDDNGWVQGQHGLYETWADADGELESYDPALSKFLYGGAVSCKHWSGSITSASPTWEIFLDATSEYTVWSERLNWEEMDCSARSELTLYGDFQYYNGYEAEDYCPTSWVGVYDINITVGLRQVTLVSHGDRDFVSFYPGGNRHGGWVGFGYRRTIKQNIVDFTYKSVSGGHVHLEFSQHTNPDCDYVKFKVDHQNQKPFSGGLTSWANGTLVDRVDLD